jgi:hypothetical protein
MRRWSAGALLLGIGACHGSSAPQSNVSAARGTMSDKDVSEVVFYGSWSSYRIPFEPSEPISREEAAKRKSYYVGRYQNKQLQSFEKYLDGKREWTDDYSYWDNGKLKHRHMTKADGSVIDQDFDRNGEIIRK